MADIIRILAIREEHRREEFDCGVEALNTYLRRYARQNHEKNIARTYVMVDEAKRVLGYYSLASASIEFGSLPADYAKRLPKYPVPAVRIARLAVSMTAQGKGLGERLLVDALKRILAVSAEVGVHVVLVDAKNDKAKVFYQRYGFGELYDESATLFMPLETVRVLL